MKKKDTRILHVSYLHQQYENENVAELLAQKVDLFKNRFKQIAQGKKGGGAGSRQEAKELQAFFRKLKDIDNGSGDPLADAAMITIVNRVLNVHGLGSEKIGKLFTGQTAKGFENVLSAIIAETIGFGSTDADTIVLARQANLGTESFKVGNINNFNVKDLVRIPESMANQLITNAGVKISKKLQNSVSKIDKNIAQVEVNTDTISNAKIDVTGVTITVDIAESNPLKHIAQLLKTASFSAKNYSLQYAKWKLGAKLISDIKFRIGGSNLDTVFFSLLGSEYPSSVILNILFYCMNTNSSDVRMKLNQLRFIYELTGYGQHYNNPIIENRMNEVLKEMGFSSQELYRANYFIWDNPDKGGSIYVRSTADLISELFDGIVELIEDELTNTMYFKTWVK